MPDPLRLLLDEHHRNAEGKSSGRQTRNIIIENRLSAIDDNLVELIDDKKSAAENHKGRSDGIVEFSLPKVDPVDHMKWYRITVRDDRNFGQLANVSLVNPGTPFRFIGKGITLTEP